MFTFKVVLLDTNFKILHSNLQIIILHPEEIPRGLEVFTSWNSIETDRKVHVITNVHLYNVV